MAKAGFQMISKFYTQDVILLNEPSSSTGGYWSTSTGGYSTGVVIKAAVNQLSAEEQFQFSRLGYNGQYKVYTYPSTEVYAGRRAEWNGEQYEIVVEPKNTLQKDHHIRFILKVVK